MAYVAPLLYLKDPMMTGKAVRMLQNALIRLGFLAAGQNDGVFGPKTKAAVLWAQKHFKITADGIVGPQTRAKLNTALADPNWKPPVKPAPKPTPSPKPDTGKLTIYSRSSWGARSPKDTPTKSDWDKNDPWHIHHTAGLFRGTTVAEEKAHMRELQSFHQNSRGYNDLAYNWLIFPSGRCYVGRGYEIYNAASGNTTANQRPSVCFVGDYRYQKLNAKQIDTLKKLKAHYGMTGELIPHSAVKRRYGSGTSTDCPSDGVRGPLGLKP